MICESRSDDTIYSYGSNDRVPKDAPHVIVDDSVTIIEDRAFFEFSSLCSISIPSSVTHIGQYAFFGCSSLKAVDIPNSVLSIHNSAFYDCSSLESINIPPSTTSIGAHCFSGCTSLRMFSYPDGTDTIAAYTFHGCKSLVSVYVPPSVNLVGNGAFQDCQGLMSICLNPEMQFIGARAFYGCDSLGKHLTMKSPTLISWLEKRFTNLPLHQVCYNSNVKYEEIEAILNRYPASSELTDKAGFTALHLLACNPYVTSDEIKLLIEKCPRLLKGKVSMAASPLQMFLQSRGFTSNMTKCRISLDEIFKKRLKLDDLRILCTLDKSICQEQFKINEHNDLYPFLSAAASNSCDLDVVYYLTRESVEVICPYIQ